VAEHFLRCSGNGRGLSGGRGGRAVRGTCWGHLGVLHDGLRLAAAFNRPSI